MDDKEAKQFYDSAKWKRKRLMILERDHHECQDCLKRIKEKENLRGYEHRIRRATEVHHIIELKEKPELALEDSNLVSLCTQCHNERHGRYIHYQPTAPRLTEEKW
jgi:5-methylcytosine-specific restriction endonuclease McrA